MMSSHDDNGKSVLQERAYGTHCRWALLLFCCVLVVDQVTKWWAVENLSTTTLNRGISWSMFDSESSIIFLLVSSVITLFIIFFSCQVYRFYQHKQPLWGASLVLAGAISNMIDRVVAGGVIDFIAISFTGAGSFSFDWPIFNIADVAILCGVLFLVVHNE